MDERMQMALSLVKTLADMPESTIEEWRQECLKVVSEKSKEFVNVAADIAIERRSRNG